MRYFVICSLTEKDEATGEPLFWSNEDGWVCLATATVFTEAERERNPDLPLGRPAPVWIELPEEMKQ